MKVFLSVFSPDLTPDQVQQVLLMRCDSSWRKGDLFPYVGAPQSRVRKQNCWRISSGAEETGSTGENAGGPSESIAGLLARVKGRESGFLRLVGLGCTVEVAISIVSANVPALNFDPEILSDLASIGASLDIDIVLTEEATR